MEDFDEVELTEEDLFRIDQEFLQSMDVKNTQHASEDLNDQQSFTILIILLVIFILGIFLAVFWISKGYSIRKRYIVNKKIII
jgi:hypothetical protein